MDANFPLRIGLPNTIASRPFREGLTHLPGLTLISDSPTELARLYHDGNLQCALLPVFDCLGISRSRIIPGIAIVTEGPSHTEYLICENLPSHSLRLTFDPTSSGMAQTAQTIIALRTGHIPELIPQCRNADGYLLTGDAGFQATCTERSAHDLSQWWYDDTELPLVHFLWTAAHCAPMARIRHTLAMALQYGQDYLANTTKDSPTENDQNSYHYRLGSAEMDSLRLLLQTASKFGLCPTGSTLDFC